MQLILYHKTAVEMFFFFIYCTLYRRWHSLICNILFIYCKEIYNIKIITTLSAKNDRLILTAQKNLHKFLKHQSSPMGGIPTFDADLVPGWNENSSIAVFLKQILVQHFKYCRIVKSLSPACKFVAIIQKLKLTCTRHSNKKDFCH